jgi:hypothetical protein
LVQSSEEGGFWWEKKMKRESNNPPKNNFCRPYITYGAPMQYIHIAKECQAMLSNVSII